MLTCTIYLSRFVTAIRRPEVVTINDDGDATISAIFRRYAISVALLSH